MSDGKSNTQANVETELLRARLETQKKDKLVHLLIGLVAGLIVGFFGANWLNARAVTGTQMAAAAGAGAVAGDHDDHDHPPGEHPGEEADGGAAMPEVQAKLKAAEDDPKNYEAQMEAAAMFHRIKNDEKALYYLKRAYALRPDDYDALLILANKTFDVGMYAEAKPLYEKALAMKPGSVDVRTDLGTTFFQLGELDKAIEMFEGSLKIDPKHEYTLQNLVVVAIQKGDKAKAEDALMRLAAVNASNAALGPLRKSLEELKTTGKIPTH